ncbi:MAG: Ig-like domain-containing protein [Muribaculaceae bacterium]|nr:Ig-like domain-containing protein [Muribaculaceae bacterium]
MKKLALALVALLPLAASCSKDGEITLEQDNVSVDYYSKVTVKASDNDCRWGSEDEFIATVSEKGEIKGEHVGTTRVYAEKDGNRAYCTVTVNPVYDTFFFPTMSWGASKQAVKDAQNPSLVSYWMEDQDENGIIYKSLGFNYPNGMPWVIYTFDNNNRLFGSGLTLPMSADDMFWNWLVQYYYKSDYETPTGGMILLDAYTLTDSDNACVYEPSADYTQVIATFIATQHLQPTSSNGKKKAPLALKAVESIKNIAAKAAK